MSITTAVNLAARAHNLAPFPTEEQAATIFAKNKVGILLATNGVDNRSSRSRACSPGGSSTCSSGRFYSTSHTFLATFSQPDASHTQ